MSWAVHMPRRHEESVVLGRGGAGFGSGGRLAHASIWPSLRTSPPLRHPVRRSRSHCRWGCPRSAVHRIHLILDGWIHSVRRR